MELFQVTIQEQQIPYDQKEPDPKHAIGKKRAFIINKALPDGEAFKDCETIEDFRKVRQKQLDAELDAKLNRCVALNLDLPTERTIVVAVLPCGSGPINNLVVMPPAASPCP